MSFRVTSKFSAWLNVRDGFVVCLRDTYGLGIGLFLGLKVGVSFRVRDRVITSFKFRHGAKVWCGLGFGVRARFGFELDLVLNIRTSCRFWL